MLSFQLPGATKFDTGNFHRIILEKTGAEIDEDEVFHSLPESDILTLLKDGEEWKPSESEVFVFFSYAPFTPAPLRS